MGRFLNSANFGTLTPNASGSSSMVTLTGRDAFARGDIVFIDVASGAAVNMNTTAATNAAAAGFSATTQPAFNPFGTRASCSASVQLADGSYVIFSMAVNSTTDTNQRILVHKYNKNGVLSPGCPRAFVVSVGAGSQYMLMATLLTSGNIALAYSVTTVGTVIIFTPNGDFIASNGTSAISQLYAIQATSDGGLLAVGDRGVMKISSTGAVTTPVTWTTGISQADNLTAGNVANARYVNNWSVMGSGIEDLRFFSISSGGWGILVSINNIVQLNYVQFNADGSLRANTAVATGYTNLASPRFAVGASGNIGYIFLASTGTTWGIISDSGTVVKAPTLIASSDTQASGISGHKIISDSSGDFLYTWTQSTGTSLGSDYVAAATGTTKSGNFPRGVPLGATGDSKEGGLLFKLSTGVGYFAQSNATTLMYSFFNNTGTSVVAEKPFFTVSSSNTLVRLINGISAVVFNDNLYFAVVGSPSLTGDVNLLVGRISNTGVMTLAQCVDIMSTNSRPLIMVEANEITVLSGQNIKRLRTSDLSQIGPASLISNWNGYGIGGTGIPLNVTRMTKYGKNLVLTYSLGGASSFAQSSNYIEPFVQIKPEDTRLIGVALADSVAGGKVEVQTKGSANCTWSWSGSFDQTAATPPGNKGSVNQQVIHLAGVTGV